MARAFLTSIDLTKNELQNATIQNLGAAPASPAKGQIYFNTGDNTLYWNAGTPASPTWVAAKDAGATSVFYQTIRDGGTARAQRNALNFVDTAGNTITVTDDAGGDESEITVDTVMANPTATTTFGLAAVNGTAATSARSDHTHGTPTHDNAAHSGITLNSLAAPTGNVAMGNFKITGLGTPTTGTDAVTKDYADNLSAGLSWKEAARAALTTNRALTALTALDGVTPVANDRILLMGQTAPAENGLWLAQTGAWTRPLDYDAAGEAEGAVVFISEGTANGNKAFVNTTDAPITIGTTGTTWVQFGAGNTYTAGAGLTGTNTFDVVAGDTSITVAADDIRVNTAVIATVASLSGYQPVDTDLTALANNATNGLWARTGSGTGAARSVAGTVPITVTNGDGVAGNPTVAVNAYTGGANTGVVPTGGSATTYLKGDATWGTPAATATTITAGNGLTGGGDLSTNRTFDVGAGTGITVAADTVSFDATYGDGRYSRKFSANCAAAVTTTVTHNFATRDVKVEVYRNSTPWDTVDVDVERTDTNNVLVRFAVAPAASAFRIVVEG